MADAAVTENGALLREAAERERELIEDEERAERRFRRAQERLADAEAKLERAMKRAERRRAQYAKAEAELRRSQEARAVGPTGEE